MDEIERIVNSYVDRANKLGFNDIASLLINSLGRIRLSVLSIKVLEEEKKEKADD